MVLTEIPWNLEVTYPGDDHDDTKREEVLVNGNRAYWLPHSRLDPLTSGQITSGENVRPRVSVLFWEQDGLSLRLESKLTREEAIRIAESVR